MPFPFIDASFHSHRFLCLQTYPFLSQASLLFPPAKILHISPTPHTAPGNCALASVCSQRLELWIWLLRWCSKIWLSSAICLSQLYGKYFGGFNHHLERWNYKLISPCKTDGLMEMEIYMSFSVCFLDILKNIIQIRKRITKEKM